MRAARPLFSGSLQVETVRKAGLIQRLLIRSATLDLPEQKLWMAVLCNAIMDLMMGERCTDYDQNRVEQARGEAKRYFLRGYYVFACDMVGLDPQWVIEVLRDHAGLER